MIFLIRTKGSFRKYVLEKQTKTNRGRGGGGGGGVLACVYVRFFLKKDAEIFKMKLHSYSQVFPMDYNGSMKY